MNATKPRPRRMYSAPQFATVLLGSGGCENLGMGQKNLSGSGAVHGMDYRGEVSGFTALDRMGSSITELRKSRRGMRTGHFGLFTPPVVVEAMKEVGTNVAFHFTEVGWRGMWTSRLSGGCRLRPRSSSFLPVKERGWDWARFSVMEHLWQYNTL